MPVIAANDSPPARSLVTDGQPEREPPTSDMVLPGR